MRAPGAAAPIAASIVDQAIDWSVKLNFGQADARTRAAFERWRRAAPEHELAWTRVQSLNADFSAVPQGLALDALTTLNGTRRRHRRVVLKSLLVAGGALGTGWAMREQAPWQRLVADVSTGLGERRALTLSDGTYLVLNTDSAVSLLLDGPERVVVLHRGEISLNTGSDAGSPTRRPFRVRTPYGGIEALGTRFVVRVDDDGVRISVQEHAVALTPADGGDPLIVPAGQQGWLDRRRAQPLPPPAMEGAAWVEGAIVGKNMRLASLLTELSRYRRGRISCAPEVADLRVSGTYHVDDTDRALAFLVQTLPIRVRYWTRYWVTVGPA
ncbi:FecR domain-containing protein [Achromobacter ruhlandii]|uniref:Protein FecR n=1 Tax=Achromobacter ruhlandii TaxID=72557 RepID=A0ABM8LUT8_9BURK|nr:FecR domain-containing protein [Achromobacter ruhlandii]AKP89972.1 Iron siderophore sensor protein [Achromobacter xylosoxidans]AOU93026.1 periplasmic ferric-dicitrate-binding protein FerR [Achromobacter ruhlandii]MCZ8432467.1 FecR domain-containing protein [Achromobacter ruhlandii]MDC6089520.1 FecR domain-containing protein [Achromobacter ruhlandii]MDC6148807.1 FecR domain-containing protein [Achromobacter ruhlandii]